MNLNLIQSPAIEPLTITQVSGQVRFDVSSETNTVNIMIKALREEAEAKTRRALITQQWELVLNKFPSGRNAVILPLPPLKTVDSIKYTDINGVEQTLDASAYRVITEDCPNCDPGFVVPVINTVWPDAIDDYAAVRITFTCGYGPLEEDGPDNIPDGIKQWMLINISNLYENRESVVIGTGRDVLIDMTKTLADSLIDKYRIPRL